MTAATGLSLFGSNTSDVARFLRSRFAAPDLEAARVALLQQRAA